MCATSTTSSCVRRVLAGRCTQLEAPRVLSVAKSNRRAFLPSGCVCAPASQSIGGKENWTLLSFSGSPAAGAGPRTRSWTSHGRQPEFATRLELGARWRERRYVSQAAQIAAGNTKRARKEQSTAAKSMAAQDTMRGLRHTALAPLRVAVARSSFFVAPTRRCWRVLEASAAALSLRLCSAVAAVIWAVAARCAGDACWTGEAARAARSTQHAARCIHSSVRAARRGCKVSDSW
jgi:hypothetical protein